MAALDLATQLVRTHEGCPLSAYRDAVGVLTIGYGHTGPEVRAGLTWSQDQAEAALAHDLAAHGAAARLVRVALSERQWAAIISFIFNLGAGAFAGSALLGGRQPGRLAGRRPGI